MKWLALILFFALTVQAQQPDALAPAVELQPTQLTVVRLLSARLDRIAVASARLSAAQLATLAERLNTNARFEAFVLGRLTRHRTHKEAFLGRRIAELRELAQTDPATAAEKVAAIEAQFKAWGIEL